MTAIESSRPKWDHLEYTWRLENFWEFRALASIEALEEDCGDVVWSRQFGDKDRGMWKLKLYPYGDSSPGGRGHVSLFLALDLKSCKTTKAYAIFGCYLLDKDGEKIAGSGRSYTRQKFSEGSCSWGWSQFIKVDGQNLNRMLVNDCITIKCDIDVFLGVTNVPSRSLPEVRPLADELRLFGQAEENRDVVLRCGDLEIPGSRFIMSARSTVLQSLLSDAASTGLRTKAHTLKPLGEKDEPTLSQGKLSSPVQTAVKDSTPSSSPATGPAASENAAKPPNVAAKAAKPTGAIVIECSDISTATAEQMMQYIHEDKCAMTEDASPDLAKLLDLFAAAKRYGVDSLYHKTQQLLLCRLVNKNDVVAVLTVAVEISCELLVDECKHFLKFCAPESSGTEKLEKAGKSPTPPFQGTSPTTSTA